MHRYGHVPRFAQLFPRAFSTCPALRVADLLPYSCLCPSRLVGLYGRVPRYALRLPSRRGQESDLDCLRAAIDATKLTEASICLGWDALSVRVLWDAGAAPEQLGRVSGLHKSLHAGHHKG